MSYIPETTQAIIDRLTAGQTITLSTAYGYRRTIEPTAGGWQLNEYDDLGELATIASRSYGRDEAHDLAALINASTEDEWSEQ